jgi:hypothetical protein
LYTILAKPGELKNSIQSSQSQKKKIIECNPGEARKYRRMYAVLAKPGEVEILRNPGEARRAKR